MKRRNAIKNLGAIGLMAALPGVVKPESNKKNKKLGVALVGLGNYARLQLAPALQLTEHCQLVGLVDIDKEKCKEWARDYNIPQQNIYTDSDFDRIADNPTIDIVYVAVPNFLHAPYTVRAFKAGKHVICEKPMCLNVTEAKAMLAAQKKAGKLLQIGYRLYYESHHVAALAVGQKRDWGKPKLIESSLGFRLPDPSSWRLNPEKGGGGAIMDLGVYCINTARRMVGELPDKVVTKGYVTEPEKYKGIYETVCCQLHFPEGAVANISTSYNASMDRFYTSFENGWLQLQPAFNAGAPVQLTSRPKLDSFPSPAFQQIAQLDAFAKNIMDDTPVLASGEEGLLDMQIIEAIKSAAAQQSEFAISY